MRERARNWPVMVFSYGILPSFLKEEAAINILKEEAYRMNELWNKLVEIGRKYLETYSSNIEEDPAIAPLISQRKEIENTLEETDKQIKQLRIKLKTKKHPALAELEEKKRELRRQLREIKASIRETKKQVKEKYREVFAQMEEEVKEAVKKAPLYWCNKEVVRDKFWAAWRGVKNGNIPKFHRFDDRWCLTWRFTGGGMPVKDAFRKVLSGIVPPEVYKLPTKKRNKMANLTCLFRQGEYRILVPIILHRPLPEGGYIKRVTFVRRPYGRDRVRLFLNFTVEVPPDKYYLPVREERKGKIAALELGFRKVDGRIRVGVLYDPFTEEKFREIFIPQNIPERLEKVRKGQSKADEELEDIKNDLSKWLVEPQVLPKLPEEIKKLITNRVAWVKTRDRGVWKVINLLKESGADPAAARNVERRMLKREKFLNDLQRTRIKALGARKRFYENLAKEIFDRYEMLIIKDISLKKLALKEMAEQLPDEARWVRFVAALGELVGCLERRAERTKGVLVKLDPAYLTRTCHICNHINNPNRPEKLFWTCEKCGTKWDQDKNAAVNLYEQGIERLKLAQTG
jgi:hypothetical protein